MLSGQGSLQTNHNDDNGIEITSVEDKNALNKHSVSAMTVKQSVTQQANQNVDANKVIANQINANQIKEVVKEAILETYHLNFPTHSDAEAEELVDVPLLNSPVMGAPQANKNLLYPRQAFFAIPPKQNIAQPVSLKTQRLCTSAPRMQCFAPSGPAQKEEGTPPGWNPFKNCL